MSRIGRKPIPIKSGVEVKVNDGAVAVKGPLGQLMWTLNPGMTVEVKDGVVQVNRSGDTSMLKALHGLTRAELQNLIQGVSAGYEKTLELTGVGYRAQIQGQKLTLNVGFAHPVELTIPAEVQASVDKQTVITLKGIDKRMVSQTAANIRGTRIPDVYKQKGIRYAGETLIKKAGKAGKK
jgi:large subunit ribosomal protein L6